MTTEVELYKAEVELYKAEVELYKAALKHFADMASKQVINSMPPGTKFQPKMTLAPFVEAHKAVYGDRAEGGA